MMTTAEKLMGMVERFGNARVRDSHASPATVNDTSLKLDTSRAALAEAFASVAALEQAAEASDGLVGWHIDEDAEESNERPEDMTAHINGLVRKQLRTALAKLAAITGATK